MKTNLRTKKSSTPDRLLFGSLPRYALPSLFIMFFSQDFHSQIGCTHNSFYYKTVSNVIIPGTYQQHVNFCAVCSVSIIHIIKSWIFGFYNNMLICLDGFDQKRTHHSICCTCTLAYSAPLSPSHSPNKTKIKRERGRSRAENVRDDSCSHGVYLYYFYIYFLLFD